MANYEIVVFLACSVAFALAAAEANSAEWTPPENPDPHSILNEARRDAAAGHFEDALAKHVWFHENALKIDPALSGVRESFALAYWSKLGAKYPPALDKMKAIRDENAKTVYEVEGAGEDVKNAFGDFKAINRQLKETSKTTELFVWLDTKKPAAARALFSFAQPALIQSKEYKLCGKYIDPKVDFKRAVIVYRENKRLALDPQFGAKLGEFGEKFFSNDTATLVAILVLNDRKKEAEWFAAEALSELDNADFKTLMTKALQGQVADPWP